MRLIELQQLYENGRSLYESEDPRKQIFAIALLVQNRLKKQNDGFVPECTEASKQLAAELNKRGLNAEVRNGHWNGEVNYHSDSEDGEEHWWVNVNGRYIVDIAAAPFGDDEIIVTTDDDERYTEF